MPIARLLKSLPASTAEITWPISSGWPRDRRDVKIERTKATVRAFLWSTRKGVRSLSLALGPLYSLDLGFSVGSR